MLYVGLDVHLRSTTAWILNEQGKKVKTDTIRGGTRAVVAYLRRLRKTFAVCFEASYHYGHLYDQLIQIAKRVVVAHPGRLRLIYAGKRKTDRIDAAKLAKLLYIDALPAVWVPRPQGREWRRLIEHRHCLVAKRTRAKNGLRAILRTHAIDDAPRGKQLWSATGVTWLTQLELPSTIDALQRDQLLMELDQYDTMIARVERELDRIAKDHPGVALLRTIPGIGPRTAEAVMAYIGDPHRFKNIRSIGSYFGLVPCEDSSGDARRLGHITRQGPSTVRHLIVEAAWQTIRHSPQTRERFERCMRGSRDRRKIALVATAHHLLRCMLAMLRSGETWRVAN